MRCKVRNINRCRQLALDGVVDTDVDYTFKSNILAIVFVPFTTTIFPVVCGLES